MRRTAFKRQAPATRPATQCTYSPRPRAAAVAVAPVVARLVVPLPKLHITRSEAYRRAVAGLDCIACGVGSFSQCAHGPAAGRGFKSCDLQTFPLCSARPGIAGCHADYDQYRLGNAAWRREQAQKWAAETQAEIQRRGLWPATLNTPGERT